MSSLIDLQNVSNQQKIQNFGFNRQMRNQPTTDYNGLMKEFQDMSLLSNNDATTGTVSTNPSYMYDQDGDGDYLHNSNTDFMNSSVNVNNKSCSSGYGGSTSLSSSESIQNLIQAYDTNSSFSNDSVFSTPTTPTTPNLQQELNKLKAMQNKSPISTSTLTSSNIMPNYNNNNNSFDNAQQQQQQLNLTENLIKLQCNLESFISTNNNNNNNKNQQQNAKLSSSAFLPTSTSFQSDYSLFGEYSGNLNKNFSTSMNSCNVQPQQKRNLTSIFDNNNSDIQSQNNSFPISNEGICSTPSPFLVHPNNPRKNIFFCSQKALLSFYQSIMANTDFNNSQQQQLNSSLNELIATKPRHNSLSSSKFNASTIQPAPSHAHMKNSQYIVQQSMQQKQQLASAAAAAAANNQLLNQRFNQMYSADSGMDFNNPGSIFKTSGSIQQQQQLFSNSGGKPLRSERLPSHIVDDLIKQAKLRRRNGGKKEVCVFCRNNGEKEQIYTSHTLKDATNRVICPILRLYTCPICQACGDNAHTIKYCPYAEKDAYMKLFKDGRLNANAPSLLMNTSFSNESPISPSSLTQPLSPNPSSNRQQQQQFNLTWANLNNFINPKTANPVLLNALSQVLNSSH
jgi:protein nanos 1